MGASLLSVVLCTFFLSKWRFETGKSLGTDIPDVPEEVDVADVEIPFQKVNLTFKDIHYYVKASTSDEQLELLKGIDGSIEAGKMTALMGSRYVLLLIESMRSLKVLESNVHMFNHITVERAKRL